MALIGSADTRALFLAAVMVMAMVLEPYPVQGLDANCFDLRGGTCDETTICPMVCKSNGYVDPVVNCQSSRVCCCKVKLGPPGSRGQPAAVAPVEPVDLKM
ncbi:hypothetical protein SETIT_6G056300v2 [Setaria italica]|uniref:Knottin scorpion toxin-like domain-containing protein n=2 Tax=Setaria TaxID=4554 RepID=A0A368RIS9_SETIT|nr:hypothetical protein SETIT_6G056300v2 [Setaria italica]TKW08874.1 hypothetical protein SEVIR_6G053800v2 [Setaria viridis]